MVKFMLFLSLSQDAQKPVERRERTGVPHKPSVNAEKCHVDFMHEYRNPVVLDSGRLVESN